MLELDTQEIPQNHEGRLFLRMIPTREEAVIIVVTNWVKLENLFIQNLSQIIFLIGLGLSLNI